MAQARKVSRGCCLNQTYPQQTFPSEAVHGLLAQKVARNASMSEISQKPRFVLKGLRDFKASAAQIGPMDLRPW
eukprot:s657_g19.t1